jgi:PleD family two-component response regulator
MGRKGGERFCTSYIRQIPNAKSSKNPRQPPRMDSPLNILLAEDERSVAFSICFALKPEGHRIEMVADGEQALAEMRLKPGGL